MTNNAYNISKESKESEAEESIMELSRISSKGQITIPIDIRKRMNLKEGDKVQTLRLLL